MLLLAQNEIMISLIYIPIDPCKTFNFRHFFSGIQYINIIVVIPTVVFVHTLIDRLLMEMS